MAAAAKKLTRSFTRHAVFGQPKLLPGSQLPTKEDVFRCYLWHRDALAQQQEGQTPNTEEILKQVATEVMAIWFKAGIPTIEYLNVLQSLGRQVESGKELQKYPSAKRTCETFQMKESGFEEVFDISPCKC
jgi:hypothetical protein